MGKALHRNIYSPLDTNVNITQTTPTFPVNLLPAPDMIRGGVRIMRTHIWRFDHVQNFIVGGHNVFTASETNIAGHLNIRETDSEVIG
jgi:hypothetical protein